MLSLFTTYKKKKKVYHSRKMNQECPKMALSILTQITAGLVKTMPDQQATNIQPIRHHYLGNDVK